MGSSYIKRPKRAFKHGFSCTRQYTEILRLFPDAQVLRKKGNEFELVIKLRPNVLSKEYDVKLSYDRRTEAVRVYVINEKLTVAKNRDRLPHVYSHKEQQLCLYSPSQKEWTNQKLIAGSIIPWASEWLFFYELWLPGGEWFGGGHDEYEKLD